VEYTKRVEISRADFAKAALRMEQLFLAPFSMLIACGFLLGSCVVVSEASHALGLRLAAGGRRLRARLFPGRHSRK
jgi:hypothetical protein